MFGEGTKDQLVAPNISPDKKTGIGGWSDSDIIRAVIGGIGSDGRALNPEMPYRYYRALSDYDLRSVVAYLRSIPPVVHQLPSNPPFHRNNPEATVSMESLELSHKSPQVERGEYLVRLGACETCHTPTKDGAFIQGLEFAGGVVFDHDEITTASSNLTPAKSGLIRYDQGQFIAMMRTGVVGARPCFSGMPWLFYGKMTDDDLKAVFAYLQSIPPVEHWIDNTVAPTACKKCGGRHGLGDHNTNRF